MCGWVCVWGTYCVEGVRCVGVCVCGGCEMGLQCGVVYNIINAHHNK